MRGGFGEVSQDDLRAVQMAVEDLGYELVTKHQTNSTFEEDEKPLTNTRIHDRDWGFQEQADVCVYEISNPSLGVGGEISDSIYLGKPVLCLFKKGLEKRVSAYTQGKQGSKHVKTPFECYAYESVEDARDRMQQFIDTSS